MLKSTWPYSGHPENNDIWIHRTVFPHRKHGRFVELGAADGIRGSSCQFLERIGWRGLCVEPSDTFFPALARNRPLATCVNACVTDHTGTTLFHENHFLSKVAYHEFDRSCRRITSWTLADLLRHHDFPKTIDYLAIDCEGSDRRILAAFPFDQYQVRAVSMEGEADQLLSRWFASTNNPFNTTCPWESYYVAKH